MAKPITVALIGGDGIGPEVIRASLPALSAAVAREPNPPKLQWESLPFGADHYLETGETLPNDVPGRLMANVGAIFLGALGDPRIPDNRHAKDILLGLRRQLDLYINFRPCTLLYHELCPLRSAPEIDFVIFRENTEGSYLGLGRSSDVGTDSEEQVVEEIHTAPKVRRLLQAAFDWATAHNRKRLTVVDKSNAIEGQRLWRRIAVELSERYSTVELEFYYVDAVAMELIRCPQRFDVIATSNLFGDILSDLGAQLVGGLGVTPSANLHPGRPGLFEPVHGSAPPLVGTGRANPIAALLSGALMLENLGLPAAATCVRNAVGDAIREGVTTPDLGGVADTTTVAQWITSRISQG